MNRKLIKDISASSVQVILNQLLGLVIFFITSRYLSKGEYGELNWSLAVLTFVTTILSFRLEQIVVRRVAAGQDGSKLLTLFAGHIFLSGVFFYFVLRHAVFYFQYFLKRIIYYLYLPSAISFHSFLLLLSNWQTEREFQATCCYVFCR
ncbi:MAG: oligosaccharide flippase family protein [Chitinophagaceae bacterium]